METKRRFSDVLGAVRYHHQRFIIEKNGTPVAALVPLEDLQPPATRQGFLSLVGEFPDADDYLEVLDGAVQSREVQPSRPAPLLS